MKNFKKAIVLIPERYKDQRQFLNYVEFIKHREYGLALESLIELAEEIEYCFPNDYWNNLIIIANKIGMTEEANYCSFKILKNKEI